MSPQTKQLVIVVLWLVAALTIIGSALVFKDTEYENAWLYITCLWIVAIPAFDALTRKK